MKCSNCGSNIPANAKFCGVCGVAVAAVKPVEPAKTVALDTSASPEIQAAAAALEEAQTVAMEAAAEPAAAEPAAAEPAAAEPAAEPAAAEPAAAEPAAAEPAAVETPKTVESESVEIGSSQPAVAAQKSQTPSTAKPKEGTPGKKGKFRETIWFMQADDPEMMSAIENENLEDREATYQDPGGQLDDRSREKFSLNISDSTMMKAMEREALETSEPPENSKGWFYASIVIGAVVLAAAVYFIFFTETGTTPPS